MFLLIQAILQERLQFMLEDTNAPILITQAHLKKHLSLFRDNLEPSPDTETKELFIEERSQYREL